MFKSKSYKVNSSSHQNRDLPALGVPKSEFMKDTSFNFLENERLHNAFERLDLYDINACNGDSLQSEKIEKENASENKETSQNYNSESDLLGEVEKKKQGTLAISRTRTDTGYYAPKRFTTTCYFAPKKNPVKFSETCIITLGSKKKNYYETVQYETKLFPQYWSEKMSVFLKEPSYTSEKVVPIPDPEYHYVSLEPQQIAAKTNNHVIAASP